MRIFGIFLLLLGTFPLLFASVIAGVENVFSIETLMVAPFIIYFGFGIAVSDGNIGAIFILTSLILSPILIGFGLVFIAFSKSNSISSDT